MIKMYFLIFLLPDSSSESSSSCSTGGATNCHSQSSCVDYNPGYCCHCRSAHFGNGRVCLQEGTLCIHIFFKKKANHTMTDRSVNKLLYKVHIC
jgi:hypothetical protein